MKTSGSIPPVERGLLKQVDVFAHKIVVSRAALVAEGLRRGLRKLVNAQAG